MLERSNVRRVGAALSVVAAIVYFLIAAGIVYKQPAGSTLENDFNTIRIIMALAGASFLLGAGLLLLRDNRWLHLLGAVLQVIVLVGYFAAAGERDPHYEAWGIICKVAQGALLVALAYLALRRRQAAVQPGSALPRSTAS
jgi:hypothetical protein